MKTMDLRKELKYLYAPSSKQVELVNVPCFNFLMIDGLIEPGLSPGNSPLFEENMTAMYGAAYTLKFMAKQRKTDPIDFPVMALEGLWWVGKGEFSFERKDNWAYTLMILQPDLVTPAMFAEALAQLRKKKGDLPGFARLRLEPFEEGRSIQIMHMGPYADEPASLAKMDAFAQTNGLAYRGKHHEIYLGDPRRSAPEKLKTILRHPVAPISESNL